MVRGIGIVHPLDAQARENVTRLAGKVAIVTGGGTGIGRAIALGLAQEGAKVALVGRRKDKLEEAAAEIRNGSGEVIAITADITQSADTKDAVAQVEKQFGKLNVLVNNAGALSVSTIESISEDDWDRIISTNLKGPFLMSRAALPAMRRAGGGSIVNIGSVLGLVAVKDRAAYCASKGGVTLLTKAMALDHAHDHIRVNCICPSVVETDLIRDLFATSEEGRKAKQARIATIPIGRFGQPQDVAGLAVFLASDESSWMTGTAIPLDGGLTAY
jgi:NAD(P)-dependent dehydrogenase (short-subunit alcohol dehydrogenase family)